MGAGKRVGGPLCAAVARAPGFAGMVAILRPGWQPAGWGEAVAMLFLATRKKYLIRFPACAYNWGPCSESVENP